MVPHLKDHSVASSSLPECLVSIFHWGADQRSAAFFWLYHRVLLSNQHSHLCLQSSSVSLPLSCSHNSAADIPRKKLQSVYAKMIHQCNLYVRKRFCALISAVQINLSHLALQKTFQTFCLTFNNSVQQICCYTHVILGININHKALKILLLPRLWNYWSFTVICETNFHGLDHYL